MTKRKPGIFWHLPYNFHNSFNVMSFIFVMIVSSVLGMVGWWVGNFFGIVFAIVLSMFASTYGIILGQRLNREYFE